MNYIHFEKTQSSGWERVFIFNLTNLSLLAVPSKWSFTNNVRWGHLHSMSWHEILLSPMETTMMLTCVGIHGAFLEIVNGFHCMKMCFGLILRKSSLDCVNILEALIGKEKKRLAGWPLTFILNLWHPNTCRIWNLHQSLTDVKVHSGSVLYPFQSWFHT